MLFNSGSVSANRVLTVISLASSLWLLGAVWSRPSISFHPANGAGSISTGRALPRLGLFRNSLGINDASIKLLRGSSATPASGPGEHQRLAM